MSQNLPGAPPPESPDDVLTVRDVMRLLHASRSKVHQLTSSGTIKAFKLGTTLRAGWRYHRRDVTAFIESTTNQKGKQTHE